MTRRFETATGRVALGGVLTATSLALLYFAAVLPSGRMGLSAVAGLCPVLAVLLARRRLGYLIWLATSVLGLLLVPDKGVVLGYATLFGLYPVLKSNFEGIKSRVLSWLCKLLYGTVGILFIQKVLVGLLMHQPPDWMERRMFPLSVLGIFVFVLYDIGLSRLIGLLSKRLEGGRNQ